MDDHTTARTPAIELRGIAKSFGEKLVFSDVSFKLSRGESLFLLGATGTGKSVLLKLVLGLLKPDSGEILIEGQNTVPLSEELLGPLRRRMGIVFQEGALFDSLSVYENVSYQDAVSTLGRHASSRLDCARHHQPAVDHAL